MTTQSGFSVSEMIFTHRAPVRFHHCDPAGIIFYPKYFELANEAVEAWTEARLGLPFAELIGARGWGLPTVALECEFAAPTRHGEALDYTIAVDRVGRSSLSLATAARAEGVTRMAMRSTLVLTDRAAGRPLPFPDDLRARLEAEAALAKEETR